MANVYYKNREHPIVVKDKVKDLIDSLEKAGPDLLYLYSANPFGLVILSVRDIQFITE